MTTPDPIDLDVDAEALLDGIRGWVEIETPSSDGGAVNRLADRVAAEMTAAGLAVERVPGRDGLGDVLIGRSPFGGDGPGILVLAHLDTVHPIGTLAGPLPWRIEGDRAYGPGVYDMKAGAHMALAAWRVLVAAGRTDGMPITLVYVADEELGSPQSRAVIEREAKRARFTLVVEPARDGGRVVVQRRGSARFVVTAHGRPAHSGGRHKNGRSAIREIAHQVLKLEAMTDYDRNVTVNVGRIEGGSAVNVVPETARIWVDLRTPSMALAEEHVARIRGLAPATPDVDITIEGRIMRPPYEQDEGSRALFEHARALADAIGYRLEGIASGGGSDGNFTAAMGIATLDGLGADGDGAHTMHEHILISSLVPRTRLLATLYASLR